MPCLRQISLTGTPASDSFEIATICDSLKLDLFNTKNPLIHSTCQIVLLSAVPVSGEAYTRAEIPGIGMAGACSSSESVTAAQTIVVVLNGADSAPHPQQSIGGVLQNHHKSLI